MKEENNKALLIIIPFFNEALRITPLELSATFTTYNNYTFLLVNDGSSDATATLLNDIKNTCTNVQVLHLAQNAGKAQAIRQGVLQPGSAQYSYIGYMDADMATPVKEMDGIMHFATQNPHYTFIMGSRIKKMGNTIIRNTTRHYFGRFFATIVSNLIIKEPVYDTQCGAKIIATPLALQLFKDPFITKWLFDVELLLRFKLSDINFSTKVYEYNLDTWIEKGHSKITLKDLLGFPVQLLKIYNRYVK